MAKKDVVIEDELEEENGEVEFPNNLDNLNASEIDTPIEGVEETELKNYALDSSVLEIIKPILEQTDLARERKRSKLENDWERYRDIYNCRRTISHYNGRSKLFLGAGKKAVDTLVRIARESILSDPYINVETDVAKWQTVGQEFMQYLVENQGKIKSVVPMLLRQLYTVGTTCLELGFKKDVKQVKYRDRDSREIKTRRVFTHYGPTYKVVDMSSVGVWPETAVCYDDLRLVYKDTAMCIDKLREMAEDGIYDKGQVEKAILAKSNSILMNKDATSQSHKEMGSNLAPSDELDVTDVWAVFKLPGQDEAQWNLITISCDVPLRIIENPWWFQVPPLLFGRIFGEHDFFYGHGIIESMEMWQYMLNDVANQTMDVGTFSLNPIIAYDPALIDDPDLIVLEPGAKIPDPNIKFERPPAQMAMEGLQMVRFLLNIIQEQSDANALVQGAPREGLGKAAGTATGVSQLFAAANASVLDQVEGLEQDIFTPLLHYTEIMVHEFMDENMVIRNTGPDGIVLVERIIEPTDLVLSTDIRWVASLRLKEKFAKSQQALNFLNIAVGIPPQVTEAQGFRINFKGLIKMVYAGLGLPGTDDIIIDLATMLPGIPPEMEIELLEAGKSVQASPVDTPENHSLHIRAHLTYNPPTELARIRMQEHIASHMQAMHEGELRKQAALEQAGIDTSGGIPGGGARGPVAGGAGGGTPVRPQEQPQYANEGAASQGILSQLNGAGS